MTLIQFEQVLFWLMMVCRKSLFDSSVIQKCTLLGEAMKILFVLQNVRKECVDRSAERKENHSSEFVTVEQKCLTHVQEMCPASPKNMSEWSQHKLQCQVRANNLHSADTIQSKPVHLIKSIKVMALFLEWRDGNVGKVIVSTLFQTLNNKVSWML